jgi:hypothetical protein
VIVVVVVVVVVASYHHIYRATHRVQQVLCKKGFFYLQTMASMRTFKFSIDRGGTFTDIFCDTGERQTVTKLLSEDPSNYKDAPTEGIRRILEQVSSV